MKKAKSHKQVDQEEAIDIVDQGEHTPATESSIDESSNGERVKQKPPAPTVAELTAQVEKLEDALLRVKAESQNQQRRAAMERSKTIRYANAAIIKSLLSVLDDFDRSTEAAQGADNLDAVLDGMKLVRDNLTQVLRNQGLEPIAALNEAFDPNIHEALMQRPSMDHAPGMIVEEVSKGYRLGDRVLRPARVIVSKAVDDNSTSESES